MAEVVATAVWTTRIEAVGLILRGRTVRTAGPIALIVGTVLSVVNQAEVIISGHPTVATWARIMVNYLVPFVVASVAYLSACRRLSTSRR
ncbi:nitrate/nitrite transporter NrtS [Actinophytocola sp.]|uniref:nitrate/nitrite transporter NrtS n=1 Tax=Actinophytocola sp. TaxID=1872138 RepID=UPI002D809942|nr:nitrate/nitrite transporter NrtS [Actinophytocola sp.]HET9144188.1 nitrate/nitrite transporter NrtS [Actinophytocola sp.]